MKKRKTNIIMSICEKYLLIYGILNIILFLIIIILFAYASMTLGFYEYWVTLPSEVAEANISPFFYHMAQIFLIAVPGIITGIICIRNRKNIGRNGRKLMIWGSIDLMIMIADTFIRRFFMNRSRYSIATYVEIILVIICGYLYERTRDKSSDEKINRGFIGENTQIPDEDA